MIEKDQKQRVQKLKVETIYHVKMLSLLWFQVIKNEASGFLYIFSSSPETWKINFLVLDKTSCQSLTDNKHLLYVICLDSISFKRIMVYTGVRMVSRKTG